MRCGMSSHALPGGGEARGRCPSSSIAALDRAQRSFGRKQGRGGAPLRRSRRRRTGRAACARAVGRGGQRAARGADLYAWVAGR